MAAPPAIRVAEVAVLTGVVADAVDTTHRDAGRACRLGAFAAPGEQAARAAAWGRPSSQASCPRRAERQTGSLDAVRRGAPTEVVALAASQVAAQASVLAEQRCASAAAVVPSAVPCLALRCGAGDSVARNGQVPQVAAARAAVRPVRSPKRRVRRTRRRLALASVLRPRVRRLAPVRGPRPPGRAAAGPQRVPESPPVRGCEPRQQAQRRLLPRRVAQAA